VLCTITSIVLPLHSVTPDRVTVTVVPGRTFQNWFVLLSVDEAGLTLEIRAFPQAFAEAVEWVMQSVNATSEARAKALAQREIFIFTSLLLRFEAATAIA
jgi:hypothetical protein